MLVKFYEKPCWNFDLFVQQQLCITYSVPGAVLNALQILIQLKCILLFGENRYLYAAEFSHS